MAEILLVDDEPVILGLLSKLLCDAGHKVATAVNGAEALELARGVRFDLAIIDLVMPEKEGIETIMDLRRENPGTQIIAMSGGNRGNAAGYLATARKLGASRTLAKPFSEQELLDAMMGLLPHSSPPSP